MYNTDYVFTARVGTDNSEQFADILKLYVPPPAVVLDMTWGRGCFWKQIELVEFAQDTNLNFNNLDYHYGVVANDLDPKRGNFSFDFRALPNEWTEKFDAVVLDPPYLQMGGIKTLKKSLDQNYQNKDRSAGKVSSQIAEVERLYGGGIIEAWRVLKRSGILIVKGMDQVQSGKQRLLSIEIIDLCRIFGFTFIDQFIFVRASPPILRHKQQIHARKNHSFWIVAKKRP